MMNGDDESKLYQVYCIENKKILFFRFFYLNFYLFNSPNILNTAARLSVVVKSEIY